MGKLLRLNVLLALTDNLRVNYKNLVGDYTKFFSKSQGSFLGSKNTYTPRDGMIDDPKKRGTTPVATTVDEKLQYFVDNSKKFINALFSQEATNASGNARAELVVDGEVWGNYSSLELLRLKSLVESKDLGALNVMLEVIPVRSDSEVWVESQSDDYNGRSVYETNQIAGVSKTTKKTPIVLPDPNLQGKELPVNYQPPIVTMDEVVELGDYTTQKFSGEWTQRDRANALRRRSSLITAITQALKIANETDSIESGLKADKIFNYIFYGS